jgi:hypothetical protein
VRKPPPQFRSSVFAGDQPKEDHVKKKACLRALCKCFVVTRERFETKKVRTNTRGKCFGIKEVGFFITHSSTKPKKGCS